jgi:hypothetical protein
MDLLKELHFYNPYISFNPNIYHNHVQGWHGDHPIFYDLLDNLTPKMILEIGTWKGHSAITMGLAAKELGLQTKIVCLDTWLGSIDFINAISKDDKERDTKPIFGYPSVYYQFLTNVISHDLQDSIIPFPQTSSIGCRWLENKNILFDLIYIDGSNDYRDVLMDLESSWPLLKEGGVIFGDDYNHHLFIDIKKAVNYFTDKYSQQDNLETYDYDLFWLIKKITK